MNKENMIEKIREKVILANNPECKTYEEALDKESDIEGCLVKYYRNNGRAEYYGQIIDTSYMVGNFVNNAKVAKTYNGTFIQVQIGSGNSSIKAILQENNLQILGLPLTLERVLLTLKIKLIENGYIKEEDPENSIHFKYLVCDKNWVISRVTNGCDEDNIIWQINKTLEKQSEETIKAIYDILI